MNNSKDSVSTLYNQLELPHLDYGNQKLLEGGPLDYNVGVSNFQHFFEVGRFYNLFSVLVEGLPSIVYCSQYVAFSMYIIYKITKLLEYM